MQATLLSKIVSNLGLQSMGGLHLLLVEGYHYKRNSLQELSLLVSKGGAGELLENLPKL